MGSVIEFYRLSNTRSGPVASVGDGNDEKFYRLGSAKSWTKLTAEPGLFRRIDQIVRFADPIKGMTRSKLRSMVLPPIGEKQFCAAVGVVYPASLEARIAEFWRGALVDPSMVDQLPDAIRNNIKTPYTVVGDPTNPREVFFRGTAWHSFTSGGTMGFRGAVDKGITQAPADVPEPEVVVYLSNAGTAEMIGVGADMTARRTEQWSALLLGLAKLHPNSTGLSDQFWVPNPELGPIGNIDFNMRIVRDGKDAFNRGSNTKDLLRPISELLDGAMSTGPWPYGAHCFLGTNLVPDKDWSLAEGDEVRIWSEKLGVELVATARKVVLPSFNPGGLTF